ncbi:MAG: hypothetical protein ABJ242_10055 [Marinomonas sp.]
MMKFEKSDPNQSESAPSSTTRMVKIGICAVAYAAALFILIWFENVAESGLSYGLEATLVLSAAAVVVVMPFLWMKALGLQETKGTPVAPSTKRSRQIIAICGLFGFAWGLLFFLAPAPFTETNWSEISLFSNSPLSPILATGSAIILAIGLIYLSIEWRKSADEHERAAVNAGMYGAIFFYSVATPVWWIMQRSMLVPAQDPMIMYVLVLIIFSAVWTYKRGE